MDKILLYSTVVGIGKIVLGQNILKDKPVFVLEWNCITNSGKEDFEDERKATEEYHKLYSRHFRT